MKVQIHIENIREEVTARDAAHLLSQFRSEAARRAPFLVRAVISRMSDLGFAGEAVRRDNARSGRTDAAPRSAEEFLDWAVARGYATIAEK